MKTNSLLLKYAAANEVIKKFIDNDPANIGMVDEYGLKCKSEFYCLLNKKSLNQFLILLFHLLKAFKKMLKS